MTLQIENLEYNVDRFNTSFVRDDAEYVSRIDINLPDPEKTAEEIGLEIVEHFTGNLTIVAKYKTYTYSNYEFESAEMFIDDKTESVMVRFKK